MAAIVEARGVHKWLGSTHVLRGVDLIVEKGDVVCILGPSGSGKTTLLRCLNHLETIHAGAIRLDGEMVGYEERGDRLYERPAKEVARFRQRIGMVFQQFNLFPHLTAMENVMVGPVRVKGLSRSAARAWALDQLTAVGLAQRADAYPRQLSGGQQQRVAIARALAMEPEVMLFDEPTSALDPELVGEVLSTMRALAASGMTMIVVTHELRFAREAADFVQIMDTGVVVEAGAADEVLNAPRHERTAQFLSHVGVAPTRVREPVRGGGEGQTR